jgi:hypothetical protein
MVDTVRTGGPPQAPKDRGYPRMDHSGTDRPKPALSDLPSGLCYGRSIGLSGMRGNSHVPFLGGGGLATGSCYPTVRSCLAPASGSGSGPALL